MPPHSIWLWIGFTVFVVLVLALDLGVFHRKAHVVTFKEAMTWVCVWVTLATIFGIGIWVMEGQEKSLEFFTGYLIEQSLSVDNVFVFALLFAHFKVPALYQHRVLFWGVLGAIVMRALMIGAGAALIHRFEWIIYIFGAFLIFTGWKMLAKKDEELHPEDNPLIKYIQRFMPVTPTYHGEKFTIRQNGRLYATPLLVVLICVEFSDVIFAVDSIPAIFAVTKDPFIVYTSNIFAIMGLRSLYFALGGMMNKFHYLGLALGIILIFIGIKMLLGHTPYKIDTSISLGVVVTILAAAIFASLRWPEKAKTRTVEDSSHDGPV